MAGFSEKSYHVFTRNRQFQQALHRRNATNFAKEDITRLPESIKSNSKHRRAIQQIYDANKLLRDSKHQTDVPDYQTMLVRNMLDS